MPTLVYVHGFLSSPGSDKAQATACWVREHASDIQFKCPKLSPYPLETQEQLADLMAGIDDAEIGLIGSSLGGFWSIWLAEHFACRAVLINPSVRPDRLVERVQGVPQHNFHTAEVYNMTEAHAEQFRQAYQSRLTHPDRYWLLVQTGDETLDYREAVQRFAGCRQTVEEGGDHGFRDYESRIPAITDFLFPHRAVASR